MAWAMAGNSPHFLSHHAHQYVSTQLSLSPWKRWSIRKGNDEIHTCLYILMHLHIQHTYNSLHISIPIISYL